MIADDDRERVASGVAAEPGVAAGPGTVARPGAVARVALRVLRAYKLLVSPLFSGACRYLPSCSDYTAEAIERHGLAAGAVLGASRICRCHPLGGSGHDPVPVGNPWQSLVVGRGKGLRAQSEQARPVSRF